MTIRFEPWTFCIAQPCRREVTTQKIPRLRGF
jgi:hypothetical protein